MAETGFTKMASTAQGGVEIGKGDYLRGRSA